MRWLRTLGWGVAGAVPGLILFAVPGFVEGQGDNLALLVGGLAWGVVGFLIGLWAGWHEHPANRRRIAVGAAGGAVLGVVLSYGVSRLYPEGPPILGQVLFVLSPIAGAFVGNRRASNEAV